MTGLTFHEPCVFSNQDRIVKQMKMIYSNNYCQGVAQYSVAENVGLLSVTIIESITQEKHFLKKIIRCNQH